MLQDNKVTKGKEYRGELRRIIGGLSKLIDLPLSNCIGILKDELFCHHIVTSCPRGKFRILHTDSVTLLFISALFRGLYLVENVTTFHPFSQVSAVFSGCMHAWVNEWMDRYRCTGECNWMWTDSHRQIDRLMDGWTDRLLDTAKETDSQTYIDTKVYPKVPPVVTWSEQEVVHLSATKCQIVLLSSKPVW